jgi:hypothetical protein
MGFWGLAPDPGACIRGHTPPGGGQHVGWWSVGGDGAKLGEHAQGLVVVEEIAS